MSYKPWIGKNYAGGAFFGQRVLLVGESHYGESDADKTLNVVQEVCDGDRYRFFTGIGQAIIGPRAYEASPSAFWHSVAFMNFLDQSAGDGPSDRPSENAFARSGQRFLQRVCEIGTDILPHRIIVFSSRSWDYLPAFPEGPAAGLNFLPMMPSLAQCGPYNLDGDHIAWAMFAKHPSRGWTPDPWRFLVATFLATPMPAGSMRQQDEKI